MSKKKDYKIIQIGFKHKKEYDDFHKEAVKYYKLDNRLTDTAYARECFRSYKKLSKSSTKEKAIALVEGQTVVTDLIRKTEDTDIKSSMITMSKEMLRLWVG